MNPLSGAGVMTPTGAPTKPAVTIYTTEYCAYCKLAKQFFKEKSVAYAEKNVGTDEAARNEMIQKSGQFGVPVIDVGGKLVIGFDKPRLSELLGLNA